MQPSRADLAGASSFVADTPLRLAISMEMVSGDTVMYYDTEINAYADSAVWNGEATIFYAETFFKQSCLSQCDTNGSCKQWREKWGISDALSPTLLLQEWLQMALSKGHYPSRPVIPADITERLSQVTGEAFAITMYSCPLDWRGLCDADIDTIFGGESLLTDFNTADISLFFDTQTLELAAVRIYFIGEQRWLDCGICISRSTDAPQVNVSALAPEAICLYEDWSMRRFDFLDPTESAD